MGGQSGDSEHGCGARQSFATEMADDACPLVAITSSFFHHHNANAEMHSIMHATSVFMRGPG